MYLHKLYISIVKLFVFHTYIAR